MALMISTKLPLVYPDWQVSSHVIAYSTTRHGGVSDSGYDSLNVGDHVGDNEEHVLTNRSLLPFNHNIQWMKQVHSNRVVSIDHCTDDIIECDALYTRKKDIFCAVMTADCVPILMTNSSGSEVAAIHAGWKGLASGVISHTVKCFQSQPEQLHAWIGPFISQPCYEVDDVVKLHFTDFESAFSPKPNGRYHFDLGHVAKTQLLNLGVSNVSLTNRCTYLDKDNFFSFRRSSHDNELSCGRQVSVIGLSSNSI